MRKKAPLDCRALAFFRNGNLFHVEPFSIWKLSADGVRALSFPGLIFPQLGARRSFLATAACGLTGRGPLDWPATARRLICSSALTAVAGNKSSHSVPFFDHQALLLGVT